MEPAYDPSAGLIDHMFSNSGFQFRIFNTVSIGYQNSGEHFI